MAAGRIILTCMPALDSNGRPVSGAELNFYENGAIPLRKAVYTTAALNVALPNPVVADAAGVFPSIFADVEELYSVTCFSPLGVMLPRASYSSVQAATPVLSEMLPVSGFGSDWILLDDASAAGQALGAFSIRAHAQAASVPVVLTYISLHGLTTVGDLGGAVQYVRHANDPGHNAGFQTLDGQWWKPAVEYLTPELFGAKGDNATDDSDAWQDCIDYAKAELLEIRPGGGKSYAIGTVITLPGGVTINGAGKHDEGTAFRSTAATGTVFSTTGDFVTVSNVQFRSTAVKTGGAYIELNNDYCIIRDCYFYHGFKGVDIKSGVGIGTRIMSCFFSTFKGATGVCIDFDTNGVDTTIFDVLTMHDPANLPLANIRSVQSGDVNVIACNLLQALQSVYWCPTAGKAVASFKITSSYLDSSTIALKGEGLGGDIVRCGMIQCWKGGGAIAPGGGNGVVLRNVGGGTCSGFDMGDCEVPLVVNGVDWDGGWTDVHISDSTLSHCTGTAVIAGNNATRWSVCDSIIGPSNGLPTLGSVGIAVGTGNDEFDIVGNRVIATIKISNNSPAAATRNIYGNFGIPDEFRIGSGEVGEYTTMARDPATGEIVWTPEQATDNGYLFKYRDSGGTLRNGLHVDSGGNVAGAGLVAKNFVDDAAASAGGVPLGGLYHNAGAARIRIA